VYLHNKLHNVRSADLKKFFSVEYCVNKIMDSGSVNAH